MYNMLHIIDPTSWPSVWDYGNRYCGGKTEYGTFQGATNIDELSRRLKTVMIRRMKRDVKPEMPPLTRTFIPVKVSLAHYREVAKNVKEAILALNPEGKGYWDNVLTKMNYLRHAVGQAKAPMAVSWAKDFLDSNRPETKLVIYAHHLDVVDRIKEGLEEYGVTTIIGSVSPRERDRRAVAYQTEQTPRCLIITSAGREGIDLYGIADVDSSNGLVVEREWRPSDEEQFEGRLDRDGQTLPVNSWYLEAKGTVDTRMSVKIEKKRKLRDQLVGGTPVNTVLRDLVAEMGETW
jgi:SWI/SNF-related matrix-associated actin-dependent regulator 1 of chromatin subfamily A